MSFGALWLGLAGALSASASLAHLAVVAGGPDWYRAFGAGEKLVGLAQRGSPRPLMITLVIASTLAAWSIYAFSGAGLLPRVPLLRAILTLITIVYGSRAAAAPLFFRYSRLSRSFIIWSSAIVGLFGLAHLIGLITSWSRLGSGL